MLEGKRVGGLLWLKQNAPGCCLWPLQPQPSHSNTFVNAWKTLRDLMLVTTVCHCNGTGLWTNHPLLPPRIRTRQSQVYSGCQELLHLGAGPAEIWDKHTPPCPLTPASFCLYWFLSLWLKFARAVPSWIGTWVLTPAETLIDPCWSTGWESPQGPALYLQCGALQTHDNSSTIL